MDARHDCAKLHASGEAAGMLPWQSLPDENTLGLHWHWRLSLNAPGPFLHVRRAFTMAYSLASEVLTASLKHYGMLYAHTTGTLRPVKSIWCS